MDIGRRTERSRADLAGAPGMEVVVSLLELRPGESLPAHIHHGIEVTYVVRGARIRPAGREDSALPTGATLLNLRDVCHAGFEVVGDTPLELFVVHVVEKGRPLYDEPEQTRPRTGGALVILGPDLSGARAGRVGRRSGARAGNSRRSPPGARRTRPSRRRDPS